MIAGLDIGVLMALGTLLAGVVSTFFVLRRNLSDNTAAVKKQREGLGEVVVSLREVAATTGTQNSKVLDIMRDSMRLLREINEKHAPGKADDAGFGTVELTRLQRETQGLLNGVSSMLSDLKSDTVRAHDSIQKALAAIDKEMVTRTELKEAVTTAIREFEASRTLEQSRR